MSMKNSNNTIGNRDRNLPAGSVAPQPTAPPHAPVVIVTCKYFSKENEPENF
jgi:hypothetical protein